jgi:sulfur relay (sulfurtransferase) complex TusBCD TusD component (DsrE family)
MTTTLLITRAGMGHADPALNRKLMASYLGLLDLENQLPGTIAFYAEGVHLACEGSHVLEELAALADRGVDLVACGTCLNFYGLTKSLRVGREGTMRDIIAAQFTADRVITI